MYRVARNYPSLVRVHDWQWYINQAVITIQALTGGRVGFVNDGLMGETVLTFLLEDLTREGLTSNASFVEGKMRNRASVWARQRYP